MRRFDRRTTFQVVLTIFLISSALIVIPNLPKSYAHAYIDHSIPASLQSLNTPPSKIDIYFNDPVDIKYSQIRVLDTNGKEVQGQNLHYITDDQKGISISLQPGLSNGIYTVTAKVLDQIDGHVTKNPFSFAVGQAVPQNLINNVTSSIYQEISVPEAIARFPALVGQVMVVGSTFATLWLWKPISRISWLRNSIAETRIKIDISMAKLTVIGSVVLLASGFAMIVVQAYSINAGILDAISTKFGNIWILRMIECSVLLGISLITYYKVRNSKSLAPRGLVMSLFFIGVAILATTSLISHGAATGQMIPLTLDFIHNIAASLWIGGIFYIAFIILPNLKRVVNDRANISSISIIIPRFSILVITILGSIAITGPVLLFVLENNLALTLASTYGKVLIIKLSLASAMLCLGAYNQTVIHKQAFKATVILNANQEDTISSGAANLTRIFSQFSKSTQIEAMIGIVLIASVAVLVDSGLPSSEFQSQLQLINGQSVFALASTDNTLGNGFSEIRFVENGSRVVLSINPFSTGSNNFKISFLDSSKNPIDMHSVKLRLTPVDQEIGSIALDANQTSTGAFVANTDFGLPGHWTVRVEGVQDKENALNLVASYDLLVRPKLNDLLVKISEFKTPANSTPKYPVYDNTRNKIWVGDITFKSGKILEFDLGSNKYTEHKIDGLNSIIYMALDSHDTLWYIDYQRKILGHYNPDDNSHQDYPIPSQGILTSIAIDSNDTIWMTSTNIDTGAAEILKFNHKASEFNSIKLANKSSPQDIAIDNTLGKIWIAEGIGKIASLDPTNNKITEYSPSEKNYTLVDPTGIILDSQTGKIYVSEHEGHAVSVFDPLLKTFKRIPLDPSGLPYGMAFDKYHNLWIAQHTIDKIAIVDPRTGESIEINIPSSNSSVQWITPDSQGNIVIAEERAEKIGTITITAGPSQNNFPSQTSIVTGIPRLGFSYVQVVAPSITGLLIVVAFFYCKGVIELRKSSEQVIKIKNIE